MSLLAKFDSIATDISVRYEVAADMTRINKDPRGSSYVRRSKGKRLTPEGMPRQRTATYDIMVPSRLGNLLETGCRP